jgi:hypothetical protein
MLKKSPFPAIIISIFIMASFGVISLVHIVLNKPLLFLNYRNSSGAVWSDYADFFQASEKILNGQNPYEVTTNRYDKSDSLYVTTPIPALANIVFVPLGFNKARLLIYLLIPLSLAFGYWLITSTFHFEEVDRKLVLMTGLIGLLFGYPFYFLLQRQNIDGWVFLFLCLGLYWLSKPKKEVFSGLFFSLAMVFKIYPILMFLPIILNRKWRLFFWVGIWLALWGAISLFWFPELRSALTMRAQSIFRFDENGSLVATISLLSILFDALGMSNANLVIRYSPLVAALVYSLSLSLIIFADYKLGKDNKYELYQYTLYLPFMIALPQIVFHYSFIICLILIPTMCHLWRMSEDGLQRSTIFMMSLGIALTQWQAFAVFNLTNNILSHIIPGLGLLVIMIGVVIFKIVTMRSLTSQVVASSPIK